MGNEMKPMIERFANGIQYSSSKDAHEMDYGVVEVPFGRVSQRMKNGPYCSTSLTLFLLKLADDANRRIGS
jgi:hypothetical protein